MLIDNNLEKEIQDARRSITSDGYPMSIGELTNLYKDKELVIRPEFQRFFRWSEIQKSRLIESLLLGIPLPSIFVSQTESGKWELVDGLQRVSTILELQGELLNEDGVKVPQLELLGTKYLPAMAGRVWSSTDPEKTFSEAQRLDVKRSKIDIKIIKRESSPETKFDLFQRLNSYGSDLTPQEIRSALLVAVSSSFFSWLESLSKYENFVQSVSLGERDIEERFDLELIVRFLILHDRPSSKLTQSSLRGFSQILDDESVRMATESNSVDLNRLENIFKRTFDIIAKNGGPNVFKRWDYKRKEYKGSFLNTSYEVFALGIGYHISLDSHYDVQLKDIIESFWQRSDMQGGYATGRSTEKRISTYVPLGRSLLS